MLEVVRSTNARTGQSMRSQLMKTLLAVMLVTWFALTAQGQGTVLFANTSTTQITNILTQLPISGAGDYKFGLYVGLAGDPNPSMLLATTTNSIFPGRFIGGDVVVPQLPGTQLAFQVRGWSSFAGATFEEAYALALTQTPPYPLVGQSTVGFFTVPASGSVILFGTGPGQVGGFYLGPVIPEPSTYALSALALAAWVMCQARRGR
jgi:hypothetical protein